MVLDPLMKLGLPLMKNVILPLAKSNLIKLRLRTAASATGVAIKKIYSSGNSLGLA